MIALIDPLNSNKQPCKAFLFYAKSLKAWSRYSRKKNRKWVHLTQQRWQTSFPPLPRAFSSFPAPPLFGAVFGLHVVSWRPPASRKTRRLHPNRPCNKEIYRLRLRIKPNVNSNLEKKIKILNENMLYDGEPTKWSVSQITQFKRNFGFRPQVALAPLLRNERLFFTVQQLEIGQVTFSIIYKDR